MYKPKYFTSQEFVPRSIHEKRGDRSFELMDQRILITADRLRVAFGPLICNNWHVGGSRGSSGLRVPDSSYYRRTSQHTFGRAIDLISPTLSAQEMREYILNHADYFPHITFIEHEVTWLHVDCRNCQPISVWSPSRNEIIVY